MWEYENEKWDLIVEFGKAKEDDGRLVLQMDAFKTVMQSFNKKMQNILLNWPGTDKALHELREQTLKAQLDAAKREATPGKASCAKAAARIKKLEAALSKHAGSVALTQAEVTAHWAKALATPQQRLLDYYRDDIKNVLGQGPRSIAPYLREQVALIETRLKLSLNEPRDQSLALDEGLLLLHVAALLSYGFGLPRTEAFPIPTSNACVLYERQPNAAGTIQKFLASPNFVSAVYKVRETSRFPAKFLIWDTSGVARDSGWRVLRKARGTFWSAKKGEDYKKMEEAAITAFASTCVEACFCFSDEIFSVHNSFELLLFEKEEEEPDWSVAAVNMALGRAKWSAGQSDRGSASRGQLRISAIVDGEKRELRVTASMPPAVEAAAVTTPPLYNTEQWLLQRL